MHPALLHPTPWCCCRGIPTDDPLYLPVAKWVKLYLGWGWCLFLVKVMKVLLRYCSTWSARQCGKKKGGQASFMLLPPMAIKCRSCFLAVSLSWWTVCLWWGWCPILESEFDFPSVDRKNRWKEDKGRSSRCYSGVIWNCCTFHSRPPLYWLEANPQHVSTSHTTSYMHVTFAYDSATL